MMETEEDYVIVRTSPPFPVFATSEEANSLLVQFTQALHKGLQVALLQCRWKVSVLIRESGDASIAVLE